MAPFKQRELFVISLNLVKHLRFMRQINAIMCVCKVSVVKVLCDDDGVFIENNTTL